MAKYRSRLPQLGGGLYLTDGGIETTLIFQEGLELPDFAAFHLLKTPEGEVALRKYFRTYAPHGPGLSNPGTSPAIQQEQGLNRDATITYKKGEGAKLRDKSAGHE